ncbi:hypothetical protein HOLleu_03293 [Holothuria leucospilota]|uniref:Uncharacterized protein n=1 Tax=Holothuria leucospilota TaxID=206669 RepID=A0A9Q1HLA1_HOLLE|nr:hypothetical protein HOLleu_03293 [Holothuria leucospilota]
MTKDAPVLTCNSLTNEAEGNKAVGSPEKGWVTGRSNEELKRLQGADPDINPILEAMQLKKRPSWESVSGGSRTLQN